MNPLISGIVACLILCQVHANETTSAPKDKEVIATVLGKEIFAKDSQRASGIIMRDLLMEYAREHKIEVSDEELNAYASAMHKREEKHQREWQQNRDQLVKELESDSLTEAQRSEKQNRLALLERLLQQQEEMNKQITEEQKRLAMHEVGKQVILQWKINQSLFQKYGGRVTFQQAGPEPVDAYREFLQEERSKGSFLFFNEELDTEFGKYFADDSKHMFITDSEETRLLMNSPWWLRETPIK